MQRNFLENVVQNWSLSRRYTVAVALFLLALLLRLVLLPVSAGVVYMTFFPALVICFYLCGTGPGALLVILSAVAGFYAFTQPYLSFDKSPSGYISVAMFVASAGLIAYVVQELHFALRLAREREVELLSSENHYRTILQDQTEFICRSTADRRLVYVNDAFCRFFGKSEDDLIGRAWTSIAHPDDLQRIDDSLQQLSPQAPIAEIENRVYAGDGSLRWCRFINRGIYDDSGNFLELQSVGRDITQRHQAQEQLRISNARFSDLASRVPAGIFTIRSGTNGALSFDYVSDKLLDMVGTTRKEAQESPEAIFRSIHPLDRPSLDESNRIAEQTLAPFRWEGRCLIHGQYRWIRIESNPNPLPDGDCLWNGVINDIEDRKILEEEVRQLAFHDPLTHLPNRRLLDDRIEVALAANTRSRRFGALMYLDLDNFKPLNDSHGHEAGDLLLIEVARRVMGCVRAMDTVARVGGDEFVVMTSELDGDLTHSTAQALSIAEKIRRAVAAPFILSVQGVRGESISIMHHCSTSIGVVMFPEDDASGDDLLIRADRAMYQAKTEGRYRACLYALQKP